MKRGQVQLVSPVDSTYGVRIRRTISLDSQKPVVTIKTVYEKVRGAPVRMSVWTITQLASPDRAFILLPQHSQFPQRRRVSRKEEAGCKASFGAKIRRWDDDRDRKNGRSRRLKEGETGTWSHQLECIAKKVLPLGIRRLGFYGGYLLDFRTQYRERVARLTVSEQMARRTTAIECRAAKVPRG
jgi:hypothetical protein